MSRVDKTGGGSLSTINYQLSTTNQRETALIRSCVPGEQRGSQPIQRRNHRQLRAVGLKVSNNPVMINDRSIDQAFSDLRSTCAGVGQDYFGLLYLEQEHKVPREKALNQVAFGGNDYSVDGFHFDEERKNFYLFKYSNSHAQFKGSLQRLIENGMEQIFVSPNRDDSKNQLLLQLRTCLVENRAVIDQVCIRFVFTGDPEEAERSQVLDKLRDPEALLKELAAGKGDGEILGWVQAHSKIPRAPWRSK